MVFCSRSTPCMLGEQTVSTLIEIFPIKVVDSGASRHATPHRKFFHDYVLGVFGHVLARDDEPCKIFGMVKVQVKLNHGSEWLLKDVRNIPSMKII